MFVLLLIFFCLPNLAADEENFNQENYNIVTINNIPSKARESKIIVAAVLDAKDVFDLNRRQNDRSIVVAVGYRIGGTFRFCELTDGVYDPAKPWRGKGNYYLAVSDTEGNEGHQWIITRTIIPIKIPFEGKSFEINWNRFMYNPFK